MQKVDIIPVACPTCKNKRLFDIDLHTEGNIQIKCPKCRSIVRVKMHRQEIHTEQIGIRGVCLSVEWRGAFADYV